MEPMSLHVTTEKAKEITDLPVELLSHVFDYIPLVEVLRTQALVSKLFYGAHRLHCRSTKQLTLIGEYLVQQNPTYRKGTRIEGEIVPLSDAHRKGQFFTFARSQGSLSSPINPSTVHLKLVAGQEEAAYAAIGDKFKSITHLELYHLAFERHYRHIVKMINAWGSVKGCPNMLTDLKVFFLPELFSDAIANIPRCKSNKNACIAYFLAEALTPTKSPALRRLTLDLAEYKLNYQIRYFYLMSCNYNGYKGPSLRKIDLSHVVAINAESFESYFLQQSTEMSPQVAQLPALREMSICLDWHEKYKMANNIDKLVPILRQLNALTISSYYYELTNCENFAPVLSAVLTTKSSSHSKLTSLTLKGVSFLEATLLAGRILGPKTTTASGNNYYETNNHLEHLRVDFYSIYNTQMNEVSEKKKKEDNSAKTTVCFQALTSLHLVRSNLLHGNDWESAEAGIKVFSKLFPNVVHLRLDGNRCYAPSLAYALNLELVPKLIACTFCRAQCTRKVEQDEQIGTLEDAILNLSSTTGDVCKAALVNRAMAAWPHLATITLQVEDFDEAEFPGYEEKLKYLFKSETLVIRDAVTGELVPEEQRVWTLKKVLY